LQDIDGGKLGGEVEVDETFIGGKARNMHKSKREAKITGRGPEGKEILFGMVERGGKVVAGHVSARTKLRRNFSQSSGNASKPVPQFSAMH
jgi:hypothetical protein